MTLENDATDLDVRNPHLLWDRYKSEATRQGFPNLTIHRQSIIETVESHSAQSRKRIKKANRDDDIKI